MGQWFSPELLATLDWKILVSSIVDIVLVYYLIYRLLLLVRGTRAAYMLLGLGIVVGVYMAAKFFHLPTLHWILDNFLKSVIVVVVVLFQDDFRRALTKVGLIPGFGGNASEALEVSIREISNAVDELASRRIGALIVVRRNVGLSDYSEHAVKIDACISHQLLVSIFLPTSPLHDGAVIIEGDRVIAAGAVLPLSFNPTISSSYGTRHRAAMGLSERTDALVVVVSEETGTISLIREGRITKDLNEKTLYNALHRLTVYRHQRKKRKARKSKKSAVDKQELGNSTDTDSEDVSSEDSDKSRIK